MNGLGFIPLSHHRMIVNTVGIIKMFTGTEKEFVGTEAQTTSMFQGETYPNVIQGIQFYGYYRMHVLDTSFLMQ